MTCTKEESLLLEKRLLLNESAINKPSVQLVGVRFGKLMHAETAESIDSEADDLIRESLRLSLEFSKQIRALRAGEVQYGDYGVYEKDMQENLALKKKDLKGLEEELVKEQKLRSHREQCEQSASLVNQQASRSTLAENLVTRKRAIDEIGEQSVQVHKKIVAKQQKIAELSAEVALLGKK